MDISRIQSTAAGTITHNRADESDRVRSPSSPVSSQTAVAEADAVQVHGAVGESCELTAARTALRQVDTLDDARKAEIQERIRSGFYTTPETIEKVSAAMAESLTPKQDG